MKKTALTHFDLIAALYSDSIKLGHAYSSITITKEMSDCYESKANNLLCHIFHEKKDFDITEESYNDVIDFCKKENDFFFYRSVLCQLDSRIDMGSLILKYDFNKINDGVSQRIFNSLNSNYQEVNVTVIPNVSSLPNTFYVIENSNYKDKEYENANYWFDNLNNHFNNIICIPNELLKGYKVNNVIIDLFKDRKRDSITIGVTPICNIPLNELMDVYEYCDEQNGTTHFKIQKYYKSKELTDMFLKSLFLAKRSKVDIFMGPEMLGSNTLCEENDLGFNLLLQDEDGHAPYLIITPSFWNNGRNFISVYLNSGELIGKQYKQNGFELKVENNRYKEDLVDVPKEILLIHVPGWGRLSFPICVDFLVAEYREILSRQLKSSIILCPSYTSGTVQFGNAAGTVRDFGSRFIWLNSCSALIKHSTNPKNIGVVTVPITCPDELGEPAKTINPICNGNCSKCCLFTINIQAQPCGERHCNDVIIQHFFNEQN